MNIKSAVFPADQKIIEGKFIDGFAADTDQGLSSYPKYLHPKYLYDDEGSSLFQEITKMPEYYPTECEKEILKVNRHNIAEYFSNGKNQFSLIEFGSGDGVKTRIIIQALLEKNADFRFIPVDISHKANNEFCYRLKSEFPSLIVEQENTDYLKLISRIDQFQGNRKVILFMGSNVGNLDDHEIKTFFKNLSLFCMKGDMVMIGFDLKKSPGVIMKAYDDPYGLTGKFILNHLSRINRGLDADFDLERFEYHSIYNPVNGKVKSFLISVIEQTVFTGALCKSFHFRQWEPIFMELSQKFDLKDIDDLASANGFRVEHHFTDKRNWFVDSLWLRM